MSGEVVVGVVGGVDEWSGWGWVKSFCGEVCVKNLIKVHGFWKVGNN